MGKRAPDQTVCVEWSVLTNLICAAAEVVTRKDRNGANPPTAEVPRLFCAQPFTRCEVLGGSERGIALVGSGKRFGADRVAFQQLMKCGTYTSEEYDACAVHETKHPERHEGRPCVQPRLDVGIMRRPYHLAPYGLVT